MLGLCFFFQAEDGIRDIGVTGVQTCALPIWIKMVGRRVRMAMAMAVPSRLWLGGVIRPRRDLTLITTLVQMVRSCARSTAIDRKRGVEGKRGELGGRRFLKKKNRGTMMA